MIPHSRPSLSVEDEEAVRSIVRDNFVAPGEATYALERAFASMHGHAHAFAVSSGTLALELAMRAIGTGPGGCVLMPAYVCAAVPHAVWNTGARPVAVDIDPMTLAPAPTTWRDALHRLRASGRRVDAIVAVHPFGFSCDVDALMGLDVPVIEDCAASLGCTTRGRPVGSLAPVAIFSLASTKMITAGAGGILATSSDAIRSRVSEMLAYDVEGGWDPGFRANGRLSNLNAALGLAQLKRLPSFIASRASIAAMYSSLLDGMDSIRRPRVAADANPCWHRYLLVAAGASTLANKLRAQDILASTTVASWYDHLELEPDWPYPGCDELRGKILSIPIYPSLGSQVYDVASALTRALSDAAH